MANIREPTTEQLTEWEEWCDERPLAVAKVARRLPPWKLYWLKNPGQRVTIDAYDEHDDDSVSLRVSVSSEYNFLMLERQVFGIDPDDLEECDLPLPGEPVGTVVSGEQVESFIINMLRPIILGPEEAERVRRQQ